MSWSRFLTAAAVATLLGAPGSTEASFPANRLGVDDVRFVRLLVDRLRREHGVDPAKARVIGYSNGGHLVYRLALELPADIQSFVALAANLPVEEELDCRPKGAAERRFDATEAAVRFLDRRSHRAVALDSVPLYHNLGTHQYAVTTRMPLAQRYFDQGLRLYYGFNHAEAIRAFREGARLDPQCAMCYWGIALAYGPNINLPMDSTSGVAAYRAVRQAQILARRVTPKEGALIGVLARRYAEIPPPKRAALDSAYARGMRDLVEQFPDDLEAKTLYAEALMDLSPWKYWNPDGSPRAHTGELLDQLERVLASDSLHPGANHFYIHAVEAVDPERALPMAERLADLMPGAGHLVHMPGHIYVRVGRYRDAIRANQHAVHADETWIRDQNPDVGVYTVGYYPHNYDFLAFAASMIGRGEQAIEAAEKLVSIVPDEMLRQPGLTFLQHHRTRHLQLKVRFGRWDEILQAPVPAADLPHARAIWHYARGRALAAKGDVAGAERELTRVRAASRDSSLADQRLDFNTSGQVLEIAAEVLAGHVAEARGDTAAAVRHLLVAAGLEDRLTYGEPPDWTVPVRQELGMVLLNAGRDSEAEIVFREDLDRFPENGWSLYGLAQALHDQGSRVQAAEVERRFQTKWKGADAEPTVGGA
jgi:tetratricopeptide (TPR) repeat protein